MRNYLFVLLFSLTSVPAWTQPAAPMEKQWVRVEELSDEFNGTSLDAEKWLNFHPYWDGRPPSAFKKENVSVSGGFLKLKSNVARYDQQGIWVNSSCVASKTKAMKPGYYSEARIKCPSLSMTGAFWFQGNYSEIDVIENFGAPTASAFKGHETHMKTNLHYYKNGWENNISSPWEAKILNPACNEAFFTYGVWWKDAETIIFYLDGKEVHTSKTGGPFNENMYMFFDMETFTWGIGLPTLESLDDSTKNTQYVDWVRTYKLEYKPGIVPVESLHFNPDTITLYKRGETRILAPAFIPANASNQNVSWNSDNPGVAPVKQSGEITALKSGTAIINCTSDDGNKKGNLVVLVDFTSGFNTLDKKGKSQVNIFPNPVKGDSFNISVDIETRDYTVKISDITGKVVYHKITTDKSLRINRNILGSKGIYLVAIYSPSFNVVRKISCY
jgi:hypothetical protein